MKIRRVGARSFLSFDTKGIDITDFGEISSFVGPNNAGKTNLFRITSFVGETLKSFPHMGPSLKYYHGQNLNEPFEVELLLDFTETEKGALTDSLICSHLMDQVNSFPTLGMSAPLPNVEPLKQSLLDYYGPTVFGSLFEDDFSIVIAAEKSESYGPKLWFRSRSGRKEVYTHSSGPITTAKELPRGFGLVNPLERIITELVQKYSEFGTYLKGSTSERPPMPAAYKPPTLIDLLLQPAESGPTTPRGFNLNRLTPNQLEPNYSGTEAFQRLRTFYRSKAAPFADRPVGFFDTIRLIFLSSIALVSDIRGVAQHSYLENLQSIEFPLYDLTYDRLPEVLFKFKNSELVSERKRIDSISKVFSNLTDGLSFNVILRTISQTIQESPALVAFPRIDQSVPYGGGSNDSLLGIRSATSEMTLHELSIQISSSAGDYPLELSAAGIAEALFLATGIGSLTDSVILLDEPAQKMHPNLQRRFLEYVRDSAKANDNQFFLITHSPYLIRGEDTPHIWRFDLKSGITRAENVGEALHHLESGDQAKIQLSMKSPDIRALLFSRGVVLVEGPSDKLIVEAVDSYLAGLEKSADLSSKEWSVVDVGGKNSFPTFVSLCQVLGLPVLIVADNDAQAILKGDSSSPVFLFTKDLEGAMEANWKDMKPLRALNTIISQIQNGDLSPELHLLGDFLRKHVA